MAFVNYLLTYLTAREEEGQGMVEYGLIIAMVSIAAIVGLGLLGGQLDTLFDAITAELQ